MQPRRRTYKIAGIVGGRATHIASLLHGLYSVDVSFEDVLRGPREPNANSDDVLQVRCSRTERGCPPVHGLAGGWRSLSTNAVLR